MADALGAAKNIIITTLQKFPFIVEKISCLPDRTYAVIIDEAHSSQGGEASRNMKEVLAAKSLAEAKKEDRAKLRVRQGHKVHVETLGETDQIFEGGRRAAGQQSVRRGVKEGSSSKKFPVL